MATPLAWLNLKHQKKRTAVAIAGVAIAVLLIFMQLGFYGAAEATATLVYDELAFDILLNSPKYIDINRAGQFPAVRLQQARAVPGVASVVPLWVAFGRWRNSDAPPRFAFKPQNIMIVGLRPEDSVFRAGGKNLKAILDRFQQRLQIPGHALVDRRSHEEFGNISPGHSVEVATERIELLAQFELGTGFGANGLILVSDLTFFRIYPQYPPGRVNLGLVRLTAEADPEEVAAQLRAILPADVTVHTRDEVRDRERRHWVEQTSIGFIFRLGVGVALIVGVVFVYQVIASDISNRLHEFATLTAMGYGPTYLARVVLQQALWIAVLGYLPGFLGALGLYALAYQATGVPISMTVTRAVVVFGLTTLMCAISGILAVRKVHRADPAELF
jgi:putative ABC transport system permease protein